MGFMRGNRSRNVNGRIRAVRSDKRLASARKTYGREITPGRKDTKIGTLRRRTGLSFSKLLRRGRGR